MNRSILTALAASVVSLAMASPSARADSAYAWGNNSNGQIGDGTTTNHSSPFAIPSLANGITAIAAGDLHSLAVQNGAVYAWGDNFYGELGDGTAGVFNNPSPVAIPSLASGVTAIAGGSLHSLAVQNGAVYAWGWDTHTINLSPFGIPSLASGVTAIAAGRDYSLAVQSGAVYAWGDNFYGQLGDGTTTTRLSPVAIPSLASGVTAIAAGDSHSFAVQNGAVYAWGYNGEGELGDGTADNIRLSPVAIPNLVSGVTAIAGGARHGLAVQNGAVYAWGYNNNGELGDGTTLMHTSPELVVGLSNIVEVAATGESSYALASDGSLWVWGWNGLGDLGLGDTTNRLTPTHLLPPAGYAYTSIDGDAGGSHVLATLDPIPEPASLALLTLATTALLRRRQR